MTLPKAAVLACVLIVGTSPAVSTESFLAKALASSNGLALDLIQEKKTPERALQVAAAFETTASAILQDVLGREGTIRYYQTVIQRLEENDSL